MPDFNPTLAASLAQTLEEADKSATAGEWSVWTSNSVRRITADRQQDGGVLSAVTHRDGMPDLSGNNRDLDLAAICTLRNHARQAAAQLRAACAEVEKLRRNLDSLSLYQDRQNHWESVAEHAKQQLSTLEQECGRMRPVVQAALAWSESFGELSKRLPPHVHELRRAVDEYDTALATTKKDGQA